MRRFIRVFIILAVFLFVTNSAVPLDGPSDRVDEAETSNVSLLIQEFCRAVEDSINHLVVSRDMHRLVRHKRQLNDFGAGNFGGFGQGSGGGGLGSLFSGGVGQGGILDGVTNLANFASLENLGSGIASGLPVLQGIGQANNMVKSLFNLDRMQCTSRLACEFMAGRGLFNRSSAFVPSNILPILPENAQGALNISHPSTFRSVLGVLQLMRFQEFGAYPALEAGLWGVAHRDYNRCRTQFTKCPSTAEAFITELNSTPGGLQSMLTNGLQTIRNTLPGSDQGSGIDLLGSSPQTSANIADLSSLGGSGNFAQQGDSGLGSLAGLLGGNNQQQQFFNPSSNFGGLGSNFGANGANNFNPANLGSLGGNGFGNINGLNGVNGGINNLGGGFNGLNGGLNGGFNGVNGGLNGLNGGLNGFNGVNGGFNGLNGGLNGLNGLNGGLNGVNGGLNGLNGLNGGFAGLNGAGSVSGLNGGFPSGFNGVNNFGGASAGLNGLNGFGNSQALLGSSFGSQFAGQGIQQAGFQQGGFNGLSGNFRSGVQEDDKTKPIQKPKWKWGSS